MKKPSGKVVKAKVMKASPKVMKASPKVTKRRPRHPAEVGWPWVQQKQLPQRPGKGLFQKYGGTTACGDRNLGEGEKFFQSCTRRKQKRASHFTT